MSIWNADELNSLSEGLNWVAKDTLKPAGTFNADYAALCRVFEVPTHPCLASRLPKNNNTTDNNNSSGDGKTTVAAGSANKSSVHFRNFTVDNTTLRIALEALKRSSDVDTLIFHNAGLTRTSVAALAEGLPSTSIRSLSLDYNYNRVGEESGEDGVEEEEAMPTGSCPPRNFFSDLVREGSKLKALSLRGNGLGDEEATAISEAVEENTVLCSLNLFDNAISDAGAEALAKTLRLNTALRGLSLARNRLTSVSAETFGFLLAGGYEVLPAEIQKRAEAESKIAAQNKIAQDAMKKKKDANVETRQPLSAVSQGEDGRSIAGGSRSLVALNLADNRDLGAGGALAGLLMRIVDARQREAEERGGGGAGGAGAGGAVVLRELHLMRCQGDLLEGGEGEGSGGGEQAGLITAASFELRPTKIIV